MKKGIAILAAGMMLAASLTGCGTKPNTVFSADDLVGKTIGAQLGTTGYIYAGDVEDAKVEPYNKGADAVQALKQGKLDAVIIDSEPAKVFVEKNDTLKILDDPFVEEEYAIAYKKGNDELGQKLDDALTQLKEDGTLDEIVGHWIGDNADQVSYTPDDSVERNGKLVMATNAEFPPYESMDGDKVVGIDVDILAAIAEDQGFEYELKSLGWDAAIAACQSGQADAMIAGASITDERKASGWMFSDGYYDSNQTLTVPEDSDIAGFADLSGKNVAVKTGTQGASYAESLKDEYGFTITYFEDSPTMYQAVLGGQCVGCFEDTPIMKASIKDGALALKVLEDTASDPAPYGFAIFSEDSQELLDMFNKGLADIKANGKYDEILAKYLG